MIKSLHIENYALIGLLDIDLHEGFSVITGETGAGKSIILGAIGLLKGGRADSKSIKTGEKRCVVEALFDVGQYSLGSFFTENDLDFDGRECLLRREITAAGKSRAFINDTPVTASLLKTLGDQLIDVHSQHQNLLLSNEQFQTSVLDIIAANEALRLRYANAYRKMSKARKDLEEALEEQKRSREDEDYWRFQLTQLDEAALSDPEEQERLEAEQDLLEHAGEIRTELYSAHAMLDGDEGESALSLTKRAASALLSIGNIFPDGAGLAERIESCYIEIKDIASEIDAAAERTETDPNRLEQVQERLNQIYTLQRKHNVADIAQLIAIREQLQSKIDTIDNSDAHINQLTKDLEQAKAEATDLAGQLSKTRKEAAENVQEKMVESLKELAMPNVRFKIGIESDVERLTSNGADKILFLFSANKNTEMQDVAKVASGGEIARVMLSLKALIASAVKLPTIIFDEIDTGVSGAIAEKMAHIMDDMGKGGRQVISITHLPQIAAMGRYHYKVYKDDSSDTTESHIVQLDDQQRVGEVAQMLSGSNLTEAALNNAKALLNLKH